MLVNNCYCCRLVGCQRHRGGGLSKTRLPGVRSQAPDLKGWSSRNISSNSSRMRITLLGLLVFEDVEEGEGTGGMFAGFEEDEGEAESVEVRSRSSRWGRSRSV